MARFKNHFMDDNMWLRTHSEFCCNWINWCSAAIHGGNVWLAVIGLLNSGIACFYYLRLLAAVYTKPGAESSRLNELRPISVSAAVGLALAAMATLILGILPSGAVSFAEYASHSTLIEQARHECAAHPEDCHLQLKFDVK